MRAAKELIAIVTTASWIPGRELVDALAVRLTAQAGHAGLAAGRFEMALAAVEPNDPFATATLVAECAPALRDVGVRTIEPIVDRVHIAAVASGFDRLAARLTR